MLKKYKILAVMIILTAGGIVLVLATWLYGSYKNRQDLFVAEAERTLFNVVQEHYHEALLAHKDRLPTSDTLRQSRSQSWLKLVMEMYPELDESKIKVAWDSLLMDRADSRVKRQTSVKDGALRDGPDRLLPFYLLNRINFNAASLDELAPEFKAALAKNNMHVGFDLSLIVIVPANRDKIKADLSQSTQLFSRPILVNPEQDQFLIAKFHSPWRYLLFNLGWQLVISVVLVMALMATFFYLLNTIRQQQQLAALRKSFVNNMTHELKTPVATVMAAIEAIQRYGARDDKARMEKYLQISKVELEHLSGMIERVLQLDMEDGRGMPLMKRTFNIIPLISDCLETARISSKKEVYLTFATADHEIFVFADESHIKNVINNLLDNAIKYAKSPVEVTVLLAETSQFITLQVADNGLGIAALHKNSVFEMFYRVPQGDLHDVKGFGIGLAYVKQVVEQHGGQVFVESEINRGSVFSVKIPRNAEN